MAVELAIHRRRQPTPADRTPLVRHTVDAHTAGKNTASRVSSSRTSPRAPGAPSIAVPPRSAQAGAGRFPAYGLHRVDLLPRAGQEVLQPRLVEFLRRGE